MFGRLNYRDVVSAEADRTGHPVSPGHLRQHMTYGDRVIVRYRDSKEGPVALEVVDALLLNLLQAQFQLAEAVFQPLGPVGFRQIRQPGDAVLFQVCGYSGGTLLA